MAPSLQEGASAAAAAKAAWLAKQELPVGGIEAVSGVAQMLSAQDDNTIAIGRAMPETLRSGCSVPGELEQPDSLPGVEFSSWGARRELHPQ